jgi:hypothetical protein
MTLWTTSWSWDDSLCIDPAVMDHWWTWVWHIMCLINFYPIACSTTWLCCELVSVDYGVVDHCLTLLWSPIHWLCCHRPWVWSIMCVINFYPNPCSASWLCCGLASVEYGVVNHQLILRWSTIHWHCCRGALVDLSMIYQVSHQLLP